MDYPWAAPGAKVVCVDDDFGTAVEYLSFQIPHRVPMLGEVLTISSAYSSASVAGVDGIFLDFEEIPLRQADGPISGDIGWAAACFRPLITKTQEQDIEMFRKIVNQEPVTA